MQEYKVKITPTAQNDFLDISERLEAQSPEEATQYYDLVMEKTRILSTTPECCPYARDSQLRMRGYRMLAVENYIYFFVIIGKTVVIRRILYAKRQYDRLV